MITSQAPPTPRLSINIEFNIVSGDDVAIDGSTVVLDFITIGAIFFGQLEVAAISEIAGDVVGTVGVVKGGYDMYNSYDASGLASSEFSWALNKTTQRFYGQAPIVGTFNDLRSLYRDLNPTITIQWTVP